VVSVGVEDSRAVQVHFSKDRGVSWEMLSAPGPIQRVAIDRQTGVIVVGYRDRVSILRHP
jgi:hypothetical protein